MPSILDEARSIVRAAESAPNTVERAVTAGEDVTKRFIVGALGEASGGLDATELASLESIGAGMSRMFNFSMLLPLVTVDLWLTFINRKWIDATSRLPGPFSKIGHVLTFVLFPFHSVVDVYLGKLYDLQRTLYHDQARVWHYTSEQGLINGAGNPVPPKPVTHPRPVTSPSSVTPAEITHLQREINALVYAVGIEQHRGSVPQSVYQQIHSLQHDVAKLTQGVTDLYTKYNTEIEANQSLRNEVASLTVQLGGLRTVTASWTDIQQAMQSQISRLTKEYNDAQIALHHQGSQIAALAPLALLLQAGRTGLRTLRQLEDTPCMCPKFGFIPNELGTALAIMEFVENG